MERDRKGFLNCNKCSRRFLTKVGFQNHLNIQHGSIVIEAQQTVHKDASNFPKEKVDERPYQSNECKTSYETDKCELQRHRNVVHEKLKPNQCQQCDITLKFMLICFTIKLLQTNVKNARELVELNVNFNVT